MSDFYEDAAKKRYAILEAAKARCIANLEEHRAIGNDMDAQEEIQTLATLNDQMASLQRLHQQYHEARNPVRHEMTEKEWEAMSPEQMRHHPEAIDQIFAKSKYYTKDQWSDPEVARRVRAGLQQVELLKKEGR